MKIEKILVPVDFSDCSRAALEYAQALAEQLGASVEALHVWYTPAYISPSVAVQVAKGETETLEAIADREAQQQMNEFLASARKANPDVPLTVRIEYGNEPETIARVSEDYDQIVMGTHGRSGVSHFFMGSVAERVIRSAKCPVTCIRSEQAK